jgi:hypothetical protein
MPTVLDHRRFAYWLGGVATACGGTPPSSIHAPEGTGVATGSEALA